MKFKLHFPTGYQFTNLLNDNIDIHIVLDNKKVFSITLFTLANIQTLMDKEDGPSNRYFWATEMVIVSDLSIETIKSSIKDLINNGYLDLGFKSIGDVEKVYGDCFVEMEFLE